MDAVAKMDTEGPRAREQGRAGEGGARLLGCEPLRVSAECFAAGGAGAQEHGQRCLVEATAISLDWYDRVVNRECIGTGLDDGRLLVLQPEELAYLVGRGWAVVDGGGCGAANKGAKEAPSGAVLRKDNWRIPVYAMLRRKGFVVRSGLKMGADFLVYRGRQRKIHSESAVLYVGESSSVGDLVTAPAGGREEAASNGASGEGAGRQYTWRDIVAKARLCATVGKSLVLVDADLNCVRLKRWTPGGKKK
eukprot:gene476-403_t